MHYIPLMVRAGDVSKMNYFISKRSIMAQVAGTLAVKVHR